MPGASSFRRIRANFSAFLLCWRSVDQDLRKKLLKDLDKSGFAAEMRTIQAIRRAGWTCSGAAAYFDRDERITRTVDARAYQLLRNWKVGDGGVDLEYHLFIEVKKSERPWIVFCEREDSEKVGDAWDNPYVSHNEPLSLGEFSSIFQRYSIRRNLGWLGYGVHEAFKDPQDKGRWYSAAITACKATYDFARHESFGMRKSYEKAMAFMMITHPVVVLDGPLISVEVTEEEESPVFEYIQFAPFEFTFSTAQYEPKTYRVDLVNISFIQEYLQVIKQRVDELYGKLYDAKRLLTKTV
jgi:hypothetical protein